MFGRLLGLVGFSAITAAAMAGPQAYSQRVQNIRAGIVILASAKTSLTSPPQSAAPYALYNLDSNTSIKPTGWSFTNPFAPSRITPEIYSRWTQLDSNTPPAGTSISKRNAPYWEVFLSQTTDEALASYDLLLVNPKAFASLNPTEQQRLRRFVDHGGVLWIDPAGMFNTKTGIDEFNNFPIPFVQQFSAGLGIAQTDFNSGLLNSAISISPADIDNLNTSIDPSFATSYFLRNVDLGGDYGAGAITAMAGGTATDFSKLQHVSLYNGNPVLSLGRIGDGLVVITARGASLKLNRSHAAGFSYTSNAGFYAFDPALDNDGLSAAKLAINMVSLMRESRQQAGGSQKVSSTAIDLNPPLIARTMVQDSSYGANQGLATPALYKGLLVTTSNGYLQVYDANPVTDLDGDGNPDDGLVDFGLGTSYDQIWVSAQLPAPLSAPVCAEVPGGGSGQPTDEVLVVDGNGDLHVFNLEPRKPDGTLSGTANEASYSPLAPPNGAASLNGAVSPNIPLAPTVHEGLAYVTDNYQRSPGVYTGRIWVVNLASGQLVNSSSGGGPFVVGGNTSSVNLPEFTYSSTIGYIPILDNSGGVDKVVYTPFAGNPSAGTASAGFTSVWIGAKGERPISFDPQPGGTSSALQVTTRASQQGGLPIYTGGGTLGVKLTIIDANGNPLPADQMNTTFTGQVQDLGGGIVSFPFANGVTSLPAGTTGVRIDYTVDWGSAVPGALTSVERGRVMLPDQASSGSTSSRSIIGAVALSPRGTAYVVASQSGSTASSSGIFGFREQGRGLFTCVSRYELYPSHTVTLNQAGSVQSSSVVVDNDGLLAMVPILNQPLTKMVFTGGPSIRNGQVVAVASAKKSGIPTSIVMAFNAEPGTAQFNVGDLPDGTEIIQEDIARSTISANPEVQTVIPQGSYTYNSDTGMISFPNLANVQRGQVQNCLSLSQPIIVRKPGQADYIVQPDSIGGSVWNPMQWFYVANAMTPANSAPVITGNSIFFGGTSNLIGYLTGNFGQQDGVLYALNAQISASQLHPVPSKPWLNQLWTIDLSKAPNAIGDTNILWPQLSTVTSREDLIIRLNQTVLGANGNSHSITGYGVVGGDGVLASWGNNGLYTYSKANFVVCDEGRVIELDPSGNPVWSADSTYSSGQSDLTSAVGVKSLVRPVRAYKLSENRYLVVDPGANRVASLNKSGVEGRSISSFQLDPNVVPNGYVAGEPLTLSGPRDALYYTTYVTMSNVSSLVSLGDNENSASVEFWQHYLIADTDNKRMVELIDRFYYNPVTQSVGAPVTITTNGNVQPQVGVLLWHTPAEVSGKNYAYTSISRVRVPDNTGGHFVYVTGIGGTLPTRASNGLDPVTPTSITDAQDGSGGVVIFDPTTPTGTAVFNSISLPDVTATNFWNEANGRFDAVIDQSTQAGNGTYIRRKGGVKHFSNLNSVTAKVIQVGSAPQIAIMVSDNSGIYEGIFDPANPGSGLSLDWFMPNEVFRVIKQVPSGGGPVPAGQNAQNLRALYARRLDSGEVLIVNGYTGNTRNGAKFSGEIMQVDGTVNTTRWTLLNLGFGSTSITLDLFGQVPGIGTRGLLMPVFADRR